MNVSAMKWLLITPFNVHPKAFQSVHQTQITVNNVEVKKNVSYYQGPQTSGNSGDGVHSIRYLCGGVPPLVATNPFI